MKCETNEQAIDALTALMAASSGTAREAMKAVRDYLAAHPQEESIVVRFGDADDKDKVDKEPRTLETVGIKRPEGILAQAGRNQSDIPLRARKE